MNVTQNNFVKSFPKIILFGIAFYNFAWVYWQNLNHFGACIICPWYITDSFPIEAFLLLISAYLLFIPHWIAKAWSIFLSGYFSFIWLWIISGFIQKNGLLAFIKYLQTFKLTENPLEYWESQIVIALMIFVLSIWYLKQKSSPRIMP